MVSPMSRVTNCNSCLQEERPTFLPLEPEQICDYGRKEVIRLLRPSHTEMKQVLPDSLGHRLLGRGPPWKLPESLGSSADQRTCRDSQRGHGHTQRGAQLDALPPHLPCAHYSSGSTNWLQPQKWPESESPNQALPQIPDPWEPGIPLSHLTWGVIFRKQEWVGQNLVPVREMLLQQKPRTCGSGFGPGGRWKGEGLEEAGEVGRTSTRRRSRNSVEARKGLLCTGENGPCGAVVGMWLQWSGKKEVCPGSSLLYLRRSPGRTLTAPPSTFTLPRTG